MFIKAKNGLTLSEYLTLMDVLCGYGGLSPFWIRGAVWLFSDGLPGQNVDIHQSDQREVRGGRPVFGWKSSAGINFMVRSFSLNRREILPQPACALGTWLPSSSLGLSMTIMRVDDGSCRFGWPAVGLGSLMSAVGHGGRL